ncbi:MAG: 50S ribosome-binding GTPase [Erysipelotrichaceae bacterium]|nr:50S ribosome-binding GTPase [Erysipelotrichaceae bacterium]
MKNYENRCQGCGSPLQTQDPNLPGYIPKEGQKLCRRCFRLIHYGEMKTDSRSSIDPADLQTLIREEKDALYVYVVDILALSDFFASQASAQLANRPLLILINKIDLLPRNANLEKVSEKIMEMFRKQPVVYQDLLGILLTQKNDPSFPQLFAEMTADREFKKIIFLGSFNAGKSSLLNRLLGEETFAASLYPCTTLAVNSVQKDDVEYIDTPGSIGEGNLLMHLDLSMLAELGVYKTIRPAVYQLYEDQSYLLQGIFRIDVFTKKPTTVIFYFGNTDLHRCKQKNADDYLQKHRKEFTLTCPESQTFTFGKTVRKDIEIPGLGFVTIRDAEKVKVTVPKGTLVREREVLL